VTHLCAIACPGEDISQVLRAADDVFDSLPAPVQAAVIGAATLLGISSLIGGGIALGFALGQGGKKTTEGTAKKVGEEGAEQVSKTLTKVQRVASPDAQQIGKGHAWSKHRTEFPEFSTADDFTRHVDDVMTNPSASKNLAKGRKAFWDDNSKTVVIRDPNHPDLGTAFKPKDGKSYFDGLK